MLGPCVRRSILARSTRRLNPVTVRRCAPPGWGVPAGPVSHSRGLGPVTRPWDLWNLGPGAPLDVYRLAIVLAVLSSSSSSTRLFTVSSIYLLVSISWSYLGRLKVALSVKYAFYISVIITVCRYSLTLTFAISRPRCVLDTPRWSPDRPVVVLGVEYSVGYCPTSMTDLGVGL